MQRKQLWRTEAVFATACVAVSVLGCYAIHARNVASAVPSGHVLSLSLVRDYASIAELDRDSELVAVVSVIGEPTISDRIPEVPTVDVPLRILHVIRGSAEYGDTLTLVQVADPTGNTTIAESLPAVLKPGGRYLVFLNRQFPGQTQMVLTGAVGAYEQAADTSRYRRMGGANPRLPEQVLERDLDTSAGGRLSPR